MTFIEKIQNRLFWKRALYIIIPFLIVLSLITILLNNFSDVMKFDLDAINASNFSDGKWKYFLASKGFISVAYGVWVTARNTK